jgi:hypothetical protein
VLPDGGVSSVEVLDTDVFGAAPVVAAPSGTTTLSSEGVRRLIDLLALQLGRMAAGAAGGGERAEVGSVGPAGGEAARAGGRGAAG